MEREGTTVLASQLYTSSQVRFVEGLCNTLVMPCGILIDRSSVPHMWSRYVECGYHNDASMYGRRGRAMHDRGGAIFVRKCRWQSTNEDSSLIEAWKSRQVGPDKGKMAVEEECKEEDD